MGCDGRFDIVAKRKNCSQGDVFIFLGLLCVKKNRITEAKKKEKEINHVNFFPLGRPYKIILQRNKNNEMKVMEQCIESGMPELNSSFFKRHLI